LTLKVFVVSGDGKMFKIAWFDSKVFRHDAKISKYLFANDGFQVALFTTARWRPREV